jgi:ribonuclease HI
VSGNWNIEKTKAQWETPWNTGPEATIVVNSSEKPVAVVEHNQLLKTFLPALGTTEEDPFNTTLVAYTDGSQGSDSHGGLTNGAGLCLVGPQGVLQACCWNLGTEIEVADAEVAGIIKALEAVSQLQDRPYNLYIFSDSQAAIHRLESGFGFYAQKARALIKALASQKTTIEVHWVPSHKGVIGNEIADRQAKAGLLATPLRKDLYTSVSHLQRRLREACITAWKANWASEEDRGLRAKGLGKHYRRVCQEGLTFSIKKPTIPELPRRHQSAYIQLKTGIGYLRAYQALIGNAEDYRCSRCSSRDRQTTTHLILHCKAYSTERKALRKALKGLPLSLQTLFCTSKGKEALADFLLDTEVCTARWLQGTE